MSCVQVLIVRRDLLLLGIVREDGKVTFVSNRITINREFVEIAHQGRPPEKRFRFGNKCIEEGCKQWTGRKCGIIDEIIKLPATKSLTTELPKCSIRSECRWFQQSGIRTCNVCPYVLTE